MTVRVNTSRHCKRFTILLLSVFAALVSSTMLFNFIIDPFEIHQAFSIRKLNEFKTKVEKHERMYKAVQIAKKKPHAILLGSSRVNVGFNPDDVRLLTGLDTYNAGFSGAEFEELYYYFEHALYHQPDLKVVVLGLDFLAFNKKLRPQPDFSMERLKGPSISWKDLMNSLFSIQALTRSYQTIKDNLLSSPVQSYSSSGQNNPLVAGDAKSNLILIKGDLTYLNMSMKVEFKDYEIDEKKVELFEKIVKTCQERSIELKAFFCPCKAIYWEAVYNKGLWPTFEKLKRQLSAIHPIWDFTGFNCMTTEAVKQEENSRLYFECSHFTPYLGKIILNKLFQQASYPFHFGYLLTPKEIEKALIETRQLAVNWMKDHDVTKQIDNMPINAWSAP